MKAHVLIIICAIAFGSAWGDDPLPFIRAKDIGREDNTEPFRIMEGEKVVFRLGDSRYLVIELEIAEYIKDLKSQPPPPEWRESSEYEKGTIEEICAVRWTTIDKQGARTGKKRLSILYDAHGDSHWTLYLKRIGGSDRMILGGFDIMWSCPKDHVLSLYPEVGTEYVALRCPKKPSDAEHEPNKSE